MSQNNKAETPKVSKKYAKTRAEHYKDIAIAVLLTGIFAFAGGVYFSGKQNAAITKAVSAVTPAHAEAAPVAPASK